MDIELKLLRSFVAIYERGSISRAADRLACTQAAMSMRLKLVETEIGCRLFERHHHGLRPTAKGSELYARALGVLAAYDEMISATRSGTVRDRIRIGAPDDYALAILTASLSRLLATKAAVEFEIICDLSANLAAALQRNELDVALVTLAARPPTAHFMVHVPLNWVHHASYRHHPDEPVALAAYPEGCVFRRTMIAALEAVGQPWHILAQSSSHAGVLSAVNAGGAVTTMARGTAPAGLVETTTCRFLPSLPAVPIYLLEAEKHPNPGQAEMAALLRDELTQSYGQDREPEAA